MIKKGLIVAFTALVLITSSVAVAKEQEPHFSAGIKVGMHWFIDDTVKDVYGNTGTMFFAGSFGWKIVDDFELDAELGYATTYGRGMAPNGGKTDQHYRLDEGPAQLGFLYRFNFVPEQIIVPYIGAGGNYEYYFEARVKNAWHKAGGKFGYHGRAGLQLLLDGIEKRASANMQTQYSIENTYFVYEFQYNNTDGFGAEGIDLSNYSHTLGILLEF